MSGLSVLVAAALCFLRIDVTQGQYTACFRGDNPLCVCTLTPESQFEVDCSFKNIMAAIDGIPNTTVSLDLSGNMLQDIPLGFLRNLSVLKLLNVENNALVVLKNDTFVGLRNLTSLFLGGNDLIDIEKDAFKSVSRLQQLRLNNNKLTIITNGTFDGLTNLNSLNLASNQLENIEPHVLHGLQRLKYLDLSYNKLSTLKESVFASSMVSYLDLSYNRFADVPCKVLPPQIVTLKLSHNAITDIQSNCFEKLEELRSVWIDGNAIKTLTCDTFPSLVELHVSGNPWYCDCSLVHAKICLAHSLQDTLVCRQPLLYSGVDIEEFSTQMFDNCSVYTTSVSSTELEQTSLPFTENPLGALFSTVKFINVTSEDCDKNCLKTKYVGLVVLVGVGCSVITLISTCIFFFLCIRNKSKKKQRRRSKLNSDSAETSGNRISEMIPMISVAEAPSGDHDRDYNQEQETFLGTFQKKNSKPQKDQPSAAVQENDSNEGYAHPQPAVVQSDQGQATRSMTPDNHYMRVTIDFDSNDAINL
ncbi:PREDICTED: leucine-rich repeat and transmembrane domain-containing protein 2-like [Branchiostoma belcheri]|uniref:Leucine-rich repeat and transmembrane domain-containing protein 2-like n=1 Tax=Branchiostoma belcheri TaxID=7741 RepID=A0A6P4ZGD1_BRABE|nr:PREDICTED: leucine-rich repeat and transmembrane domain-containing protein 2-like [Branchiostoma belcheri]